MLAQKGLLISFFQLTVPDTGIEYPKGGDAENLFRIFSVVNLSEFIEQFLTEPEKKFFASPVFDIRRRLGNGSRLILLLRDRNVDAVNNVADSWTVYGIVLSIFMFAADTGFNAVSVFVFSVDVNNRVFGSFNSEDFSGNRHNQAPFI